VLRLISGLSLVFLFLPGLILSANAQLAPAIWDEQITLRVPNLYSWSFEFIGLDPSLPESYVDSLSGAGCSTAAALSYGPPGPPSLSVHAEAHHYTGDLNNLGSREARSIANERVTFNARVRQVGTPPVPVSTVPVVTKYRINSRIRGSTGSCTQTQCPLDAAVMAQAVLLVYSEENGQFVNRNLIAQNYMVDMDGSPDLVNFEVPPGEILYASLQALVTVAVEHTDPGSWGEANASVQAQLEVSPNPIPGTMAKYSDYFQMEYSPGYSALENSTPVIPTTWGKLKTIYSSK